jgi:hypothetical protein
MILLASLLMFMLFLVLYCYTAILSNDVQYDTMYDI